MDKQEILKYLVNRRIITDDEAISIAELSLVDLQSLYDDYAFGAYSDRLPASPESDNPDDKIELVGGYPDYPPEAEDDDPNDQIEIVRRHPDYPFERDRLEEPFDLAYDEDLDEVDDDPRCICGVYRSEHALCGCSEGFQTAESWARERESIRSCGFRENDYYDSSYCDDDRYPFGG